MKRMLINATQHDEIRVAITDGPQLIDLDIEVSGQEQKKSNIYKGVISSIEPSLGAVFVNYGSERHGFLPLKEISHEYFLTKDPEQLENPDIKKVLREGQPLVIQVEKEERGSKGAALTTFISLAGSYLVLMPNNPRAGGISRRIEGEERDQLRTAIGELSIPEEMGVIIRTAGVGKLKSELEWDLTILLRYWEAIKQAATIRSGPYLIHQESDVIIRAIRDNLRQDIEEIIIDDENAYQRAFNYLSQIRPDFINRLKLYKDALPLFSRFQIEQQIETAYQREVRLPSGGSLAIDHTEALVAIDINSARATKGSNIEETALNINLEAAEEIARQLRIRDIGGLVVIDFIDMTPVRHQREVENCLRNALRHDRARIQIGRISRFGLMEMSRQRIRSSLTKSNHLTCPRCEGQGTIRSIESQALAIIHLLQEQAAKSKSIHFQLQLPLDLNTFITNEKRGLISEIERLCQVKITILPNEFLQSPQYVLKQLKCNQDQLDHGQGVASYKLLRSIKTESNGTSKKTAIIKPQAEPAINQFLSTAIPLMPTPSAKPTASNSLIKRLWTKMFGAETQMVTKPPISTPDDPQRSQDHRHQRGKATGEKSGRHHHRHPRPDKRQQPQHQHSQDNDKQETARSGQQPARGGRTRRGSRGGQHRRHNPNRHHHSHGDHHPENPPPQSGSTRDFQPPYPEDIDDVLPQSENPRTFDDKHSDVPDDDGRGNK